MAAKTVNGANSMTYPVSFSITCTSESSTFTMGSAFSPIAARLQPRKMENTTICRISLRAIASTMLVGTACEINTFRVKGSD